MGMDRFEDLMSAITYAEAGDHERARALMKGRKTVLLAVSDRTSDGNALKYALNISERVEAVLEILYVLQSEDKSALRSFASAVKKDAGFNFSLVVKQGCMKKAILDYTDKRGEILFVIAGAEPELDAGCEEDDRAVSAAWKKLKCPLVVVSKAEAQ